MVAAPNLVRQESSVAREEPAVFLLRLLVPSG